MFRMFYVYIYIYLFICVCNPFLDALRRFYSRRIFKNNLTKGEIAHLTTMFSTVFNDYTLICSECLHFCISVY